MRLTCIASVCVVCSVDRKLSAFARTFSTLQPTCARRTSVLATPVSALATTAGADRSLSLVKTTCAHDASFAVIH